MNDTTWRNIKENELRSMYESGMSIRDISIYYNAAIGTIYNRMKEYGIKTRTLSESVRKDFSTKEELEYMYKEQDMTIAEIAEYYSVGIGTIWTRMKEYGIEKRVRGAKRKDFSITKEDIEFKYNILDWSHYDISNYYNVSPSTIWNRMKEFGIEVKTPPYESEEERKEARKETYRRHNQTEKRKELLKKYNSEHRQLGFIPLNKPFDECHGHHVNKEVVIHIPAEIHQSISHNVWTGQGMEEINKEAFEFLEWEMRDKQWAELEEGRGGY